MGDGAPGRTSPWVAFGAGVVATLALVLALWAIGAVRQVNELRLTAAVPMLRELPRLPGIPGPGPR